MVDFSFKRKGIKFREVMFAVPGVLEFNDEDVLLLHGSENNKIENNIKIKNKMKNIRVDHQYTLISNLLCEEDKLWSLLNKNYRNEIKRAKKEGIVTKSFVGQQAINQSGLLDTFEGMYNKMFESKGMGNRLNRIYVEAALKANQMTLTCAYYNDQILVIHAYVNDSKNALLLYSTSLLWEEDNKELGKKIGWSNKLLHWDDMNAFKKNGLYTYEWGGIQSCNDPNGIDKFKMGFGGSVVQYDNYIIARTLLGALYILLIKVKLDNGKNNS
jgi:lipid II:glycine glycyltransferase (peptidoglycan interpeptide bridge formation enzyme)